MQVRKTREYDKFKLRDDNRLTISLHNVERIVQSIKNKNMLHMRPITVNEDMEIVQGQHRYLAAKQLGIDIYYTVQEGLTPEDIISLNIGKAWNGLDYLNFYVKNGYQQYVMLHDFIKKNRVPFRTALNLVTRRGKRPYEDFKKGLFVFTQDSKDNSLQLCYEFISIIVGENGSGAYLHSNRFWKGLLRYVDSAEFNHQQFLKGLKNNIHKVRPLRSEEQYVDLFKRLQDHGAE